MARLMLSAGMFSAFAAATAVRRRGFFSGSPPLFAAMVISLIRRVKILPRLASSAPFLCLIVAHLEWPDMTRYLAEIVGLAAAGDAPQTLRAYENKELIACGLSFLGHGTPAGSPLESIHHGQ